MISTCGLPLVHSDSLQMWRNVATALPKLSKTESLEEKKKNNEKMPPVSTLALMMSHL